MLVELFKIAQNLDAKSEFALASEVDAIVAELARRAGVEDLISLANYLDEIGNIKEASRIDALISNR